MSKAVFGEYSAFTTQGGVRFMKDNKLVARDKLPVEVSEYLERAVTGEERGRVEAPQKAKFPRPSEAELARMRAESIEKESAPLEPADFPDATGEPLPRTDEPVRPPLEPDFLESVSIHTASLVDMAEALFNRFGLYTVYLSRLPEGYEINPLTGEPFSKYHLGIAYQAAIRAQSQGILTRDPELNRKAIDANHYNEANFQDTFVPVPQTMGQARQANSFDFRTSVRGTQETPTHVIEHVKDEQGNIHAVRRELTANEFGDVSKNGARSIYSPDDDEPIVEPQPGRQVIRPDW